MLVAHTAIDLMPFLLAVGVVVVCSVLWCWRFPAKTTGLVKSPAGIPIIGHIEYLNPEALIPATKRLAAEMGPAIELYLFRSRYLLICDVASTKEILIKRPKTFRRDYGIETTFSVVGIAEHSLFSAEGHTWSRLRRLLSTPFNKQNLSRMAPLIQVETNHLVAALAATNEGVVENIEEPLMNFTLRTILRVAFDNVDLDEHCTNNQLLVDTNTLFSYITQRALFPLPAWVWNLNPPEIEKQVLQAGKRMDRIVGKIVETEKLKMEQPEPIPKSNRSFIQMLLAESTDRAHDHEGDSDLNPSSNAKLSSAEAVANIKTMILAGSETTSVSLSWTLYYLSIHKHFFDRAREEADEVLQHLEAGQCADGDSPPTLPFCSACFKEAMRLKGPAAILGAALVDEKKPYILGNGVEIRPFDTVLCTTEQMMEDPEIFVDPLQFNPTRWLFSSNAQLEKMNSVFFSFGYGSRICPGMHLAKLEGELALAHIVKNFDLKLGCSPGDVKRVLQFTVKAEKIPMRFIKRLNVASI